MKDKITQHILEKWKHAPSYVQEEKIEDHKERDEARKELENKLDKAIKKDGQ